MNWKFWKGATNQNITDYQSKIKRLLAYSAISHVGFLLLGFVSFTNWSIFSVFFYLKVIDALLCM